MIYVKNDLLKISQLAYQWKMIFNPDVSKQAQEVVFSHKGITTNHTTVYFNKKILEKISKNIRGTSKKKLYPELGYESLRNRRWLRRMSCLYKIISIRKRSKSKSPPKSPPYFYELIPPLQRSHLYPGCFKTLRCRTELFRNSFLPFTANEWNKLDSDIKNSDSYAIFREKLLAFYKTCR